MDTFEDRLRMQKLVYLAKSFGVKLDYGYNWYLHGPYSRELTRDLYEITQNRSVAEEPLSQNETRKIDQLKSFLGKDSESPDRLELLASIQYLKDVGKSVDASDQEILQVLREKKRYFSEQEIQDCWNKSLGMDAFRK